MKPEEALKKLGSDDLPRVYQVCEKWLKDRKGRTLSKPEIAHYHKIIVAVSETLRLTKEIDDVIEKHAGWPEAFQDHL